jgi:hypothetical protein
MADETRSGDSKVRAVRLLGHRDDAGAWGIRDFLKRSVVEFQWIELLDRRGLPPRARPVLLIFRFRVLATLASIRTSLSGFRLNI